MNQNATTSTRDRLRRVQQHLDRICTRDFGRVFGQWRRLSRQKSVDERALAALEAQCDKSMAKRDARRAAKPHLELDAELPVTAQADTIIEAIRTHRVIVVAGATGSGKTTQLPKLCLQAGRGEAGLIGVTQPRRLAARSVARRVAEEMHVELGQAVGFKVRFNEQVGPQTLVKFMTDGILLQETQSDHWLSEYDTLIIDEAHERSLNIDFLLGFLKQLLQKRRNLKVIITSATIDTARFAAHFDDAPVIEVEGRTYPVEVRWRPVDDGRMEQGGAAHIVAAVDELTETAPWGDILVFLPGEREIRDAHRKLQQRQYRHTEILPLYARLSATEQDRVFKPGNRRRIVLATNVAETSLTVPRIRAVVDTGLARVLRYSQRTQIERLHVEPISQAAADQRKGRCGRVGPGICIRLYAEDDFAQRDAYTDPELLRAALSNVILRMLALKLGRVEAFPFLDRPDERAIKDGYRRLSELSAIDEQLHLTPIGHELARLPLDAQLGRMLLEAQSFGVLPQMLIIVAFLSVQDPRERPPQARAEADAAHRQFADPKSDFVGILNLWQAWQDARAELGSSKRAKWCKRHYLGYMRLREWSQVYRQLKQVMTARSAANESARKPPVSVSKDGGYSAIHLSLLAGFPLQVGHKDEHGLLRGTRERKFAIFPGSALAKKPPRWIFAAQILDIGGKVWAMHCARVEPQWIERQGAHLIRKTAFDPYWSRKRGAVVAYEQVTLFGLTLVPRRVITYHAQDPKRAHQIFLLEALVRCELDAKADFIRANARVLQQAEEMEAKQRQQGLIRAEDELAAFFEGKLPDDISDARALDAWYRRADKTQQQALRWALADIVQDDDTLDGRHFPTKLTLGDKQFRLTYRFVPGDAADGVTLHVPLAELGALPATTGEWLVPGMLRDKVAALIRTLPKSKRRNFVPAPDFAQAFVETEPDQTQTLAQALARFLWRTTGVEIHADAFAVDALPPHLTMRFVLHDAAGKKLEDGRDIRVLQSRWKGQARAAFIRRSDVDISRERMTDWTLEQIPQRIQSKGRPPAFPALVDKHHSVALEVFARSDEAQTQHVQGVRQLLWLTLEKPARQAARKLPLKNITELQYAPLGNVKAMRMDLVHGAFNDVVATLDLMVHTRDAFAALQQTLLQRLFKAAVERLLLAEPIIATRAEAGQWLEPERPGRSSASYADMHSQLACLLHAGFLRDLPHARLAHYPRYLAALKIRAERLRLDPGKDHRHLQSIQPYWQAYLAYREAHGVNASGERLHWLLEEWRVSLFAQALKTAEPVSEKRVRQALEQLEVKRKQA